MGNMLQHGDLVNKVTTRLKYSERTVAELM